MRKNDKGLSLIELIVVIAILAILAGGIAVSLSIIPKWKLNQCASSIDMSLNKAKMVAMSKAQGEFILDYSDGTYHVQVTEEVTKDIAKDPVKISYVTTAGETKEITEGEELKFTFDRSSGAFKPIAYEEDTGKGIYCTSIIMERGEWKKEIELVYLTGKHKIK